MCSVPHAELAPDGDAANDSGPYAPSNSTRQIPQTLLGDKGENAQGEETVDINAKAMGVNYTELVPVLIKAIQEQQGQIERLEKRLQELEKH